MLENSETHVIIYCWKYQYLDYYISLIFSWHYYHFKHLHGFCLKKTGGEFAKWAFICTSTFSNSRAATATAGHGDVFWISAASFHIRPAHNNTVDVRPLPNLGADIIHVAHAATTSTVGSSLRCLAIVQYRRRRRVPSYCTWVSSRWADVSSSAAAGDRWFCPNSDKKRMMLIFYIYIYMLVQFWTLWDL